MTCINILIPLSLLPNVSVIECCAVREQRITESKESAAERGSITVFPVVSHSDIDYTVKLKQRMHILMKL